jgi:hypothetical protein
MSPVMLGQECHECAGLAKLLRKASPRDMGVSEVARKAPQRASGLLKVPWAWSDAHRRCLRQAVMASGWVARSEGQTLSLRRGREAGGERRAPPFGTARAVPNRLTRRLR